MTDSMFRGLIPALVLPFDEHGAIDAASFDRLITYVSSTSGVTALAVNGHAGEATSLTPRERRQVVELAVVAASGAHPIVAGIAAETAREACEQARDAEQAGAAALLVLPPALWLISKEPAAPAAFFGALTAATDLPVILFQYPDRWGSARYDAETLLELTALDGVAAVKDASWEVSAYEEDLRLLERERPEIAVLCANDEHLLPSFCVGAHGSLVGFASIVPDLIADMLAATAAGDLGHARELNDRLYPLTRAFYKTQPTARMHSRIKHGLYKLGVIASPVVRDPLLPLDADERRAVEDALAASRERAAPLVLGSDGP
jgi:4-hydroxy-tetrahydrodipicolinate synthase